MAAKVKSSNPHGGFVIVFWEKNIMAISPAKLNCLCQISAVSAVLMTIPYLLIESSFTGEGVFQ